MLGIGKCPQISPRPSPEFQLVTATFKHHAKQILDVHNAGESDAIGTTPNHPFWSVDKQKFIRADELTPGEQVQKADGTRTTVTQIVPRAEEKTVFNLEVQLNHTFHVGNSGVLVHNSKPCDEFVTIAHGTSRESAASIRNGLDSHIAYGRSKGGSLNQPGHFHTHAVGPANSPGEGLQLAYEWGLRHSESPVVLVGKIPKELYNDLVSRGLARSEDVGVGLNQIVFHPDAFMEINKIIKWINEISP